MMHTTTVNQSWESTNSNGQRPVGRLLSDNKLNIIDYCWSESGMWIRLSLFIALPIVHIAMSEEVKRKVSTKTRLITIVFREKESFLDKFGLFFAETDPNLTDSDCFSPKWTQTCLKWTVFRENGPKPDRFGLFLAKTDPNLIDLDCFSRKWIQTWLIWTVSRQNGSKPD